MAKVHFLNLTVFTLSLSVLAMSLTSICILVNKSDDVRILIIPLVFISLISLSLVLVHLLISKILDEILKMNVRHAIEDRSE